MLLLILLDVPWLDANAMQTVVPAQLVSPPSTTPIANNGSFFDSGHSYHGYNDTNFDLDYNFDMTDADVEAIMANATQDFWASFPGEVGYS
jgi:hypothetical protein